MQMWRCLVLLRPAVPVPRARESAIRSPVSFSPQPESTRRLATQDAPWSARPGAEDRRFAVKYCPRCYLTHSVLIRTAWGPRCIYCARLDRDVRLRLEGHNRYLADRVARAVAQSLSKV